MQARSTPPWGATSKYALLLEKEKHDMIAQSKGPQTAYKPIFNNNILPKRYQRLWRHVEQISKPQYFPL